MRMWNLPVERMCNQHLLGEHVEMHMFAGTLNTGRSVRGYLKKGLLEIHNLKKRHREIAQEMQKRNMNHQSPIQKFKIIEAGKIDPTENLKDLTKRCKDCRKRFSER